MITHVSEELRPGEKKKKKKLREKSATGWSREDWLHTVRIHRKIPKKSQSRDPMPNRKWSMGYLSLYHAEILEAT